MRLAIVALALAISLWPRASFGDEREAFSRAAELARQGQDQEALALFLALHDRSPADTFADDALLEAARLYEEKLGEPARAAEVYERLLSLHPQSRLSLRAKRRAELLRENLGPGGRDAWALAEYNRILFEFAAHPRSESIARMEDLLARAPRFAGAPRATFWLGSQYQKDGRLTQALATFRHIQSTWPESELARRAQKAEGDVLVLRGDFDGAELVYRHFGQGGDAVDRETTAEALRDLSAARWEARALGGAFVLCGLFVLFMLGSMRRQMGSLRATLRALYKPPFELYYFLPLAALFAFASLTEHYALGQAICVLVVGALVVTWLSGAVLDAVRARRGRVSLPRALLHA
jgi:tetratricopeptide (TPR) repeat protein